MVGQPYSGKPTVRLDERREDACGDGLLDGDTHRKRETQPGVAGPVPHRRLPPTLHAVLVFAREEDARRVAAVLPKRLARYGLTLHPEKTRLVAFQQPRSSRRGMGTRAGTFDFLGFTHYWSHSRRGYPIVKRHTAQDRMTRALRAIRRWCRAQRHLPVAAQHRELQRKLQGHDAYYGITGNAPALERYRYEVRRSWRKWLDRRSNRARMGWDRFRLLLERYRLPPARVVHSVYRLAASP
jgi:hypothetical protein